MVPAMTITREARIDEILAARANHHGRLMRFTLCMAVLYAASLLYLLH